MGIECKVCLSEKRDYIEQLILQGNSNLTISATLKDMNEDISHASIGRHKTKHMPDYADTVKENSGEKGNRKYDREDSKNAFVINANAIYDAVKKETSKGMDYNQLADNNTMMQLMLNRIVNNQLAITIDLQEKYMKGETKYPNEQIRGLQIVQEIVQKFEVFYRKNFEYYNKMVTSDETINNQALESGKKAKLNMMKYMKGDIFRLCIKCNYDLGDTSIMYRRLYIPVNPYSTDYYGVALRNNYDIGIHTVTSEDEHYDYKILLFIYKQFEDAEIKEQIDDLTLGDYIPFNQLDFLQKNLFNLTIGVNAMNKKKRLRSL